MDNKIWLEVFGYAGTVLVIVSMMMRSINKLRIINMCGSVISTIYSAAIGAWPIVLMNLCLFSINGYHLTVEYRRRAKEKASNTGSCQVAAGLLSGKD